MSKSRVFTFIVILLLSTLACQAVNQVLEPQATLAPPPTAPPDGETPPDSPDEGLPPAEDEGTAAPVATPTLALADTLPAPSLEELGPPPEALEELETWLGDAHAANGALDDVCAALREAQWQQAEDSCEAADLDGDDREEWLLTLDITHLREADEGIGPILEGHPGDFWIVNEEGAVYMARGSDELDFFSSAPTVVDVVDMTGDDLPEVVTVFTTCGAHTCFYDYQIIGAPDGEIRNLVQPAEESEAPADAPVTISLAYVEEEEIRDANDDDLPDLVISGGMIGSAGAGIQRPRVEVWAWDGSAISRDSQEWADTGYRFHTLYNANYDFSQEDYDLAAQKYEAAIVDPNLEDVEGFSAPASEVRDNVRQFAAFRLSLLPLTRGDITESSRWRTWLQDEYPHAPLTEAAHLLYSRWEANGNDLVDACAAVTEYLDAQSNPTGPLTDMGYANPSLTADEVCPIR
ncbi:MAG TPA: hypothetical protein VK879_03670 [Candidatus Sulfomarinibacteraceae bacterium]|nr:hypothetical protein [Candidatus Sulfomarinibacteraceae bacterium]